MSNVSITFHDLNPEEASVVCEALLRCRKLAEPTKVETEEYVVEMPFEIEDSEPAKAEEPTKVEEPKVEEPTKAEEPKVENHSLSEIRQIMADRAVKDPTLKSANKAILHELGLAKLSEANQEQLNTIWGKLHE